MTVRTRLAAFAVVLGLAAGGGALVGAALGPEPDEAPAPAHGGHGIGVDAPHGDEDGDD